MQIQTGGIKHLGEALGSALRGGASDELIKDSVTHPLHTYPARMHPATARALVALCFEAQKAEPRVVLDPFCGSGTTLVEGRALGLDVIGSDLNPLAVRIARAKIWASDKNRLDQFRSVGKIISASTFEEGKAARRADYEPRPIRVPKGVDQAAREEEIAEWFAPHVRRELEFIAAAIDELREEDDELAELFSVCLSSILIKCSKRNSDTSSKIVKRNIGRGMPARWFGERVELMCEGLIDLHQAGAQGSIKVLQHDARDLAAAGIAAGSVGAIISSPPYVGTYDYVDHHRLRLAFLGLPFDAFEKSEMGARRRFKGRASQATEEAFADFRTCLDQFYDLLAPGGQMALMVGDSVAGVEPVWADELLRDIAGSRFKLLAWASQERDKLGGLEKRAFGSRAKREHILLFEKKAL
jgi:SAM-dependent methyltransferase